MTKIPHTGYSVYYYEQCYMLGQNMALSIFMLTMTVYLVSDADKTIVQTHCQVLPIISPATTGDTTAYFIFGHRLLFRWPQTWLTNHEDLYTLQCLLFGIFLCISSCAVYRVKLQWRTQIKLLCFKLFMLVNLDLYNEYKPYFSLLGSIITIIFKPGPVLEVLFWSSMNSSHSLPFSWTLYSAYYSVNIIISWKWLQTKLGPD